MNRAHGMTAAERFAVEMTRACLRQVPGYHDGLWMHMMHEPDEGDRVSISLAMFLEGMDASYGVNGEIVRCGGVWSEGACTIYYGSDRAASWSFTYRRVDGRLQATLDAATQSR